MVDEVVFWKEDKKENDSWVEVETLKDTNIRPRPNDFIEVERDRSFIVRDKEYSLKDEKVILNIYLEDITVSKRKDWEECENKSEKARFMTEEQINLEKEKTLEISNIDLKLLIEALTLKMLRSKNRLVVIECMNLRDECLNEMVEDEIEEE